VRAARATSPIGSHLEQGLTEKQSA